MSEHVKVGPPLEELPGVSVEPFDNRAVADWLAKGIEASEDGEFPPALLVRHAGSPSMLAVRTEDLPELVVAFAAAHWGVLGRKVRKARGLADDPDLAAVIGAFAGATPERRAAVMGALRLVPAGACLEEQVWLRAAYELADRELESDFYVKGDGSPTPTGLIGPAPADRSAKESKARAIAAALARRTMGGMPLDRAMREVKAEFEGNGRGNSDG